MTESDMLWGIRWINKHNKANHGMGKIGFTPSHSTALAACDDLDREYPYLFHFPMLLPAPDNEKRQYYTSHTNRWEV